MKNKSQTRYEIQTFLTLNALPGKYLIVLQDLLLFFVQQSIFICCLGFQVPGLSTSTHQHFFLDTVLLRAELLRGFCPRYFKIKIDRQCSGACMLWLQFRKKCSRRAVKYIISFLGHVCYGFNFGFNFEKNVQDVP